MIFTPSPAKATNKKNHPIQGSNSNHNAFFFGVVNVEINLANVTTNGAGGGVVAWVVGGYIANLCKIVFPDILMMPGFP